MEEKDKRQTINVKDRIAQLNQTTNRKLPQPPPRKTKTDSPTMTPMSSSQDIITTKKSDIKLPPVPMKKQQTGIDSPLVNKPLVKTQTGKGVISKNDINEKLVRSPRILDEGGFVQKTPPPRPVSRVVQKGDLNEVQDLIKNNNNGEKRRLPLPPARKGMSQQPTTPIVSSPSIMKLSEQEKRSTVQHRTPPLVPVKSFTTKDSGSKSGFTLFIPKVIEEDDEEDEEAKKKAKKKKYSIDDETLAILEKKYEYPTKQQISSVIKIQKLFKVKAAKKLYSKMVKADYQRKKLCQEFLDTEAAYVNDLKVLSEVYLVSFRENIKSEKPLISQQDVSNIFADLDVIIGINEEFLTKLKIAVDAYDRHSTSVGQILKDMAPYFKTYTRYCNNYDRAISTINKNKNNSEFKQYLTQTLDKNERTNKLGIQSYLIKPIQRIPRYRLLIQDIIKYTDKDHTDYKKLNEGLEGIMKVAKHLNDAVSAIEATNIVIAVANQFNSNNLDLVVPHRRFVKDGLTQMIDASTGTKLHLHLFNDILIYSTGSVGNFTAKGKIDLVNASLYDYVGDDPESKFQIKSMEQEIILIAGDKSKKAEWMSKIYNTIELCKHNRKDQTGKNMDSVKDDTATTFSLAMSEENIEVTSEEAILAMKEGAVLLKYTRQTKPHFRKFILSEDEKVILWGSPKKTTAESSVALKDVRKILLGQQTVIFSRYKNPTLEEISFSLIYQERTLDIVCKDKREYITWVKGISYLLSRGDLEHPEFPTENNQDNIIDHHEENKKFKETFSQIGDAFSWGSGSRGAVGNGKQEDSLVPQVVKDFLYLDVESIYCENSAFASLTTGGELFSWGSNDSGRLGHGDEIDRFTPTLVKALQGRKIVMVGMGSSHTLLLEDNGVLWAYGSNKYGQLGLGTTDEKKLKPTPVSFFKGMKIASIAAGSDHSFAILSNGSCYSWGKGEDGQLGHGDQKNSNVPKEVVEIKNLGKKARSASLGSWHSLILLTDGSLLSCGNSTYGQTGHEHNDIILKPTLISALKGKKVIEISSGSSHNAIITDKGDIYTWGNGSYGQIGNDKKENCSKPKLVVMLINDKAKMICCGLNHVVALMHSGKVYSWGAGTYGRLGIGDEGDKFTPQIVELFEDKVVRKISAGGSNSGAVTAHQWVPDKDVKECMQCKDKFTFLNRRHHCRNCGGLFCGSCSSKKVILLRFGFDAPVRVCDNCYQILNKK
eukprot:gene11639-4880_t